VEGFVEPGDAEPARPCLRRRPGHGEGAVPIPVRLDDSHDLRAGRRGQPANIFTDMVEVDFKPGGKTFGGHG
jgi:hypothetical protein